MRTLDILKNHGAKVHRAVHTDGADTLFLEQSFYDAKRMMLEITSAMLGKTDTKDTPFKGEQAKNSFNKFAMGDRNGETLDLDFQTALATGEVPDFAVFTTAVEAISKELSPKLQSSMGEGMARVRRWDEYDGELDTSRLDDDRPFLRRSNALTTVRTLNVEYHIAASYKLTNTELTQFGAMVFAVIKTLESNGVLVRLTIVKHNNHAWDCISVGGAIHLTYTVKEPGQYLSDADLAFACHMMFYRKLAWATMAVISDALVSSKKVDPCIGGTNPLKESVKFDADSNTLRFSMNQTNIGDAVIREILKALSSDRIEAANIAS